MPFAVELFLDERSESRVREIWAALDGEGVESPAAIADANYHPHVSLAAFEVGDVAAVGAALRPVFSAAARFPLQLTGLGFFLTPEAPAFLSVIPSSALLRLHRAVHEAILPLVRGMGGYYLPDQLLPHCTLAMGVADKAKAIDVVSRFQLPIMARSGSGGLVEIPGGRSLVRFELGWESS